MRRDNVGAAWSLIGSMLIAMQVGCTTAVKHVYYEVRGAKVNVMSAQEELDRETVIDRFAPYSSYRFEPATTTLGPAVCPQPVLSAFDTTANQLQSNEDLSKAILQNYPGGAPTLVINTEVQFVESRGLLGTALLLARVKMTDGATTVLDALVMTQSKSFREGGREELAEESAEGIGRFLIHAKTGEKDLDDMLP